MFLLSYCLQYHVHIVYIHGLVMFGLFLGGSTWFRLCLSQPMRHSDTMAGCVQRPRHCPSRSRALLQCRIACQVSYWKDVMYRELQLRRSKIPSLRRFLTFFDHLNHDIYIIIYIYIYIYYKFNCCSEWCEHWWIMVNYSQILWIASLILHCCECDNDQSLSSFGYGLLLYNHYKSCCY